MTGSPRGRTPLHHWHTANGARFMESDGWLIPAVYSDVAKEVAAAGTGLALADLSAYAKTSLIGRDVPELIGALLGETAASQARGVAIIPPGSPALACRLTSDHLLLLAAETSAPLAVRLASLTEGRAVLGHDVTSSYAGFCLIGPHGENVLRQLTPLDVSPAALPAGSCAETSLAGVHALLVRSPEWAVPATWIYVAWDLAEYVWERLMGAGKPFGCAPLGREAWRSISAGA
jgi:heterotetrameric sarcosine oxidase gamma subunit